MNPDAIHDIYVYTWLSSKRINNSFRTNLKMIYLGISFSWDCYTHHTTREFRRLPNIAGPPTSRSKALLAATKWCSRYQGGVLLRFGERELRTFLKAMVHCNGSGTVNLHLAFKQVLSSKLLLSHGSKPSSWRF